MVGGIPRQLDAPRADVAVVIVCARRWIFDVTIARSDDHRGAGGQIVAQGAGDRAVADKLVIRADSEHRHAARRLVGAPGDDLDGAAYRVLAVEGSLRPAHNFHAIDVQLLELRAADAAEIDVV